MRRMSLNGSLLCSGNHIVSQSSELGAVRNWRELGLGFGAQALRFLLRFLKTQQSRIRELALGDVLSGALAQRLAARGHIEDMDARRR